MRISACFCWYSEKDQPPCGLSVAFCRLVKMDLPDWGRCRRWGRDTVGVFQVESAAQM